MPSTSAARAWDTLGTHHSQASCNSRREDHLPGDQHHGGFLKGARWTMACHVSTGKCRSSISLPASWTSQNRRRSCTWNLQNANNRFDRFDGNSQKDSPWSSQCPAGPLCGPHPHRDPGPHARTLNLKKAGRRGKAVAEPASLVAMTEDDVAAEEEAAADRVLHKMRATDDVANGSSGSVVLVEEEGAEDHQDSILPAEEGGSQRVQSTAVSEKKDSADSRLLSVEEMRKEVRRRRNFAIISHPDAGKTTLTEKLLLYGGAIHEAGAVKARRAARHATSDWMELEQQRDYLQRVQAFTDAVATAKAQEEAEAERQRLAKEAAAQAQQTAEDDAAARDQRNAASTESLIHNENQWTTILEGMIFVPSAEQADPTLAEVERTHLANVMLTMMRAIMWNNTMLADRLNGRIDHVVKLIGDIGIFNGPDTISSTVAAIKTDITKLQTRPDAATKSYKMPHFDISKFDDHNKTDALAWWQRFLTEASCRTVPDDYMMKALYLQLIGGAQTWMNHLAATHTCTIAELHTHITWREFEQLWFTRFMVRNVVKATMNEVYTCSQGSMPTRD
ncbi:hypothetical protein CBR_g30592 [Chara braunii]|uniref:Tr-type G domain-containing protein n=1 Tax=Chara braunii TaxID=69332 RepID=A0A388LD39_CHABU|nr:hypothetical protein CBR_g30592 [Chara braunii]|eukprot:GBG80225.1 hypothetical protein CBR_g30592 [Chara braunii]